MQGRRPGGAFGPSHTTPRPAARGAADHTGNTVSWGWAGQPEPVWGDTVSLDVGAGGGACPLEPLCSTLAPAGAACTLSIMDRSWWPRVGRGNLSQSDKIPSPGPPADLPWATSVHPCGVPPHPPRASRLVLAAHRGERGPWSWTIRPEEKPPPSPSFPSPTGGRVCTTCPGSLCPPQSVLAGQDRTALLSPCSLLPQASAGAAVGGAVLCPGLGWTLCSQSAPVWQGMSAP